MCEDHLQGHGRTDTTTLLLHLSCRWTLMYLGSMWSTQILFTRTFYMFFYSVGLQVSLFYMKKDNINKFWLLLSPESEDSGSQWMHWFAKQKPKKIEGFSGVLGEKNSIHFWSFGLTLWIYSDSRLTTPKMNLCTWTVTWNQTLLLQQEQHPQHPSELLPARQKIAG